MRNTTVRNTVAATVLVAFVAISTPVSAREAVRRGEPRNREAGIVLVIKKFVKKVFGVTANESITIPFPNK